MVTPLRSPSGELRGARGGEIIMSPRVKIVDEVGKVLFDQTFSDQPGSGFQAYEGTGAVVIRRGIVEVKGPSIRGAYEAASGRPVHSGGLWLHYAAEAAHRDLHAEIDGRVTNFRVSAEAISSTHNPERR